MFVYGLSISEQCREINGCKACWKIMPVTVKSELCPNASQPCSADPSLQKYNSMMDMIICACGKADSGSYADTELNSKIESAVKEVTGYTVTASDICSQPGMLLTKRMYG